MIKTDYHELPRVTKPTYMIYSLINLDNGKRYIGRTHSPRGRMMNHFNSIKKHEHVNEFLNQDSDCRFGYEILEENVTKKNAKEREVYYMIHFKTYDQKFGYNVSDPMMNIMKKT